MLYSITLTAYKLTTKHSKKTWESKAESTRRGLKRHAANPGSLHKDILPYTQSSATGPDRHSFLNVLFPKQMNHFPCI